MPDLSCADYSFPLLTRSQALTLVRLLEFERVDLGLFERNGHAQTSAMMASPARFAGQWLEDLKRSELGVADVFVQIGMEPREAATNDPDPTVRAGNREVFKRALEFGRTLGCDHMTGLPGVPHDDARRDFDLAVEETGWRVEAARAAGVRYAVEAHIGSICADTGSARRLLAAVPGLTLTLDYGHFVAAGEGTEAVHGLLADASHLHLRGGAPGHLQTGVAENAIDFGAILERLKRLGYKGALALEYVWIDWAGCNRSDTLSETILLRRAVKAAMDSMDWRAEGHV